MTYRIRYYLCALSIPFLCLISWNIGHTSGLKDMMDSFDRSHGDMIKEVGDIKKYLCELPVSGSNCPKLPVRKPK